MFYQSLPLEGKTLKLPGGDLAGDVLAEQFGDLELAVALADGPHQLGHGGLRGHIQALDHPQLQKLTAHLVDAQVGAVVEALGGDYNADAGGTELVIAAVQNFFFGFAAETGCSTQLHIDNVNTQDDTVFQCGQDPGSPGGIHHVGEDLHGHQLRIGGRAGDGVILTHFPQDIRYNFIELSNRFVSCHLTFFINKTLLFPRITNILARKTVSQKVNIFGQ